MDANPTEMIAPQLHDSWVEKRIGSRYRFSIPNKHIHNGKLPEILKHTFKLSCVKEGPLRHDQVLATGKEPAIANYTCKSYVKWPE
ncbi:uncharacterized protein J3R85_008795 [Psidium guajava]|nr:uncharacterized protein J3R85_008795 [Psidium guajava]